MLTALIYRKLVREDPFYEECYRFGRFVARTACLFTSIRRVFAVAAALETENVNLDDYPFIKAM